MNAPICPLLPLERGFLYAFGVLRFLPYREPPKSTGRPLGRKNGSVYGHMRAMAEKFVADSAGLSMAEFAAARRLDYDSFKGAVWRLKNERKAAA